MEDAPFTLKVRLLKTEVVETRAVRVCDLGLSARSTSLNSERHTTTSFSGVSVE